MSPHELQTLEMVRERADAGLNAPALSEIARRVGVTRPGAKYILDRLVAAGHVERTPGKARDARPAGHVVLRGVPSRLLVAELARRGETIATLGGDYSRSLAPDAVTCAHEPCGATVRRGHLFCRPHWFALPDELRASILNAFGARDAQTYGEAISEAKLRLEGAWRGE